MKRFAVAAIALLLTAAQVLAQALPFPGPGAALGPSLTFTASVTQTAGAGGVATGRTYTGVAIGTAAANRTVIVADGFRDAGNCPLSSMTIGGISATRVAQNVNSVTNTTITSIWVAAVPTGTTATIVTVYCASTDSAEGLGVYAAYGLNSSTPTATSGSSSSTAPSLNLNVSAGGMVIAVAWALGQSQPMCSWTGVTSDYDMPSDPTSSQQIQDGASAQKLPAASPKGVSCTYGASCAPGSFECSASAASFR